MSNISYEEFNRAAKLFNTLRKEEIDFTINFNGRYGTNGTYLYDFLPNITNMDNLEKLSKVFETKKSPIHSNSFINSNKEFYTKVSTIINSERVNKTHDKQENSPVKFFSSTVLPTVQGLEAYVLTTPPKEEMCNERTYRLVCSKMLDQYNNPIQGYNKIVACVNELSPLYNYLDQSHVIVFSDCSKEGKDGIFVTDQFTLDINYLAVIFSLHPSALDTVLQNEVFLPAQNARLSLLKAEKALPPRFQDQYRILKEKILTDFESNAQNVMVSKLVRNEVENITLNEIKLTRNKATYETISIEAENLQNIVFKKLNANEDFDIYTFISIFTDYVEDTLDQRPVDATGMKFQENFSIRFKINEIPIEVSVGTQNTRRRINGMVINKNELSKTLRRAACHETLENYNGFVKKVSRLSLMMTDVLANGLPVKTVMFQEDQRGAEATQKHPKINFKRVGGKFHIVLGKDKDQQELPIKKFGELVKKINSINKRASYYDDNQGRRYAHNAKVNHEGAILDASGKRADQTLSSVELKLVDLLPQYIEGLTKDQMTKMLFSEIKKKRLEAIMKSEELLKMVVKMTGAEKGKFKGVDGYFVQGTKIRYHVEEASLKCHKVDNGEYVCIVNKGDLGVGADALVTRLFALKNDQRVTQEIGTLAKHV